MRIDYSPPRQSTVTPQSKPRPRKEPVGKLTGVIIITGVITFCAGFGSGWFLSERTAKKAFQAAAEQNSLENAPKPVTAPPVPTAPPAETPAAPAPQSAQPQTSPSAGPTPATSTPTDPQLSFYKNLPNGHSSNLMGSGVNIKDTREKLPLQAAIPSNLKKPQAVNTNPKPANASPKPAVAETPSVEKKAAAPAAPREPSGYTVQVASYSLKSEADGMRTKLAGKGYNVFISESNQGDKGTWYRVRVGKRLDQDAAKELASKIGKGAFATPEKN